MAKPLQGKVAIVTGGSRGLGAATARSLADAGADVAITYVRSADKAAEVIKELEGKGVQALALQSDQSDPASASHLIEDVVARFGGLDILVNNAAINNSPTNKRVGEPDADLTWLNKMHATNYFGVIAIIREAAAVMHRNGRIITISSGVATRVGSPGFADYAATKAGVVGYTKGVARDLAPRGITANIVSAGLMATSEVPLPAELLEKMTRNNALNRLGDPAETAAVISFLAGPDATFLTGAVIDSNGGYTA